MASGGEELEVRYVLDTRPLINFILTGREDLVQSVCAHRTCTTRSVRTQFEKSAKLLCSGAPRVTRRPNHVRAAVVWTAACY